MARKHLNARYASIGFVLLFSIACNTLFSTPTPTAVPTNTPLPTATATATPTLTATPLPDYNGEWNGTTSQDKAISITIENNEVTSLIMEIDTQGSGCTTNFKGALKLNVPVADGAFEGKLSVYNGELAINGTFDSQKSVSGNFIYTDTGGCPSSAEVEWSATKGGSEK